MIKSSVKSAKALPLQLVLVVPFVIQIFAAVGLTGYLSLRNGQKAVNDVSSQLRQEISDRITLQVLAYLEKPYTIGQTIAIASEEEQIDLTETKKLERTFWRLVSKDMIQFIQIGFADGTSISVEESVNSDGSENYIMAAIVDKESIPRRRIYKLNDQGERTSLIETQPKFDPRVRPWYIAAQKAGKPTWASKPFLGRSQPFPTITISHPIYDKNSVLVAVANNSFWISKIHRFLRNLKVGQTGQTFIIDRAGNLIASSTIEQPFIIDYQKKELQQIPAVKADSLVISGTSKVLLERFGSFNEITQSQQLEFTLNNQRQLVQVSNIRDEYGIDWLSIIVVPESDFMAQIDDNTRTTIFLCLGALIVATILGLYTAKWIALPILKLQQASEAIASGELDRKVEGNDIKEIAGLARAFNQMAIQLKTSFTGLEIRVSERTEELQRAKEEADSANQAKSEFLANMSHELRTPLNGILGYAQILNRSKGLQEKERHGINIIYQCGSHLLTLINDVLELSKIEARKLELQENTIHLPSFLQGVVEICRVRADQKGLEFIYESETDLPEGIETDEKRLRQVIINLLSNAIKFTDKGQVIFRVGMERAAEIKVEVEDTGVGIAEGERERIFQAFEQVGEKKRQSEGTGLGLAISQRIVQMMGGEIQVKSELGKGSIFSFRIGVKLAEEWVKQKTVQQGQNIIGYEGERKEILIVDDKWENRSVIVNLLEPLGFRLTEAENGQIGLEKARENHPDLVITDLAMPVMDGFEMLSQIRADDTLKGLIVIVSSASVGQEDRQKSLEEGGDDFLEKPVHSEELFRLLGKHLQIKWSYEEGRKEEEVVTLGDLVVPPEEDLRLLLDLALAGLIKKLGDTAGQIGQRDVRYLPFVQQIQLLAKGFKTEKIEALLRRYLPN
ncbi:MULTISPECIES: ATP-binding protein [Pseudanabaena]|nr:MULTISPECIES: ATP-binding protein [Pseudanabaena]MDG3494728.1 ATP-binding protein [Pseudanabaena catenata USMAC16]